MLELKHIITNGTPLIETISNIETDGWNFVCIIPACYSLPTAMPTDKLTIFSKII